VTARRLNLRGGRIIGADRVDLVWTWTALRRDRADRVGAVLHKAGRPGLGMLHVDRQIEVANRSVAGIAPSLDERILQWPGELALELHARQVLPCRRLLRTRAAGSETEQQRGR
jgi:hypothetical protein